MPQRPPQPCQRCRKRLTTTRYCSDCQPQAQQQQALRQQHYEQQRGSAHARGYTRQWDKASKAYLADNPLCVDPYREHQGRPVAAQCVDHVTPHKGDPVLFWDQSNWQSLCRHCHSVKTAREDGRWTGTPVAKGEGEGRSKC